MDSSLIVKLLGDVDLNDTAEVRKIIEHLQTTITVANRPTYLSIPDKEAALRLLRSKVTTQSLIIMAESAAYDSYVTAYNFALACKVRDVNTPIHGVTLNVYSDDVNMRVHNQASSSGVPRKPTVSESSDMPGLITPEGGPNDPTPMEL